MNNTPLDSGMDSAAPASREGGVARRSSILIRSNSAEKEKGSKADRLFDEGQLA